MRNRYQKKLFDKNTFFDLLTDKWRLAALVFLISFLMFEQKMPRTITGQGSSDMFISSGYRLGLMESPGYPIYTLLLFVFTHLPFLSSPAMGAHLLSGVMGALTLSLVFLTGWQFYENGKSKKYILFSREFERFLLALTSTGMLLFSSLFWSTSMVAEKYAFSGLILSAFILLSIIGGEKYKKKETTRIGALGILLGIGLSHQWVFVALVPVYIFILYRLFGKDIVSNSAKFIAGTLTASAVSFGLLMFYAQKNIVMSPVMGDGVLGLWDFVSAGYFNSGTDVNFLSSFSLSNVIVNIWEMGIYLLNDSYWFGLLPLVFVALFVQKNRKFGDDFLKVSMAFATIVVMTAVIIVWPESNLNRLTIVREFVPTGVMISILSWFGFAELLNRFGEAGTILFDKSKVDRFMTALLIAPIVFLGFVTVNKQSLQDYDLVYKLNQDVLDRVAENSIVTCFSYASCNSLAYLQLVEGRRSDVTLVPFHYKPNKVNIANPDLQGFGYTDFPLVMYDIVTWNLESRDIYAVDIFQDYFDLFGTNFGFMYIVPDGYVTKFSQNLPTEFTREDFDVSQRIVETGKSDWPILTDNVSASVARRHMLNASVLMKMGMRQAAMIQANLASNIYHLLGQEEALEVLPIKEGLEKIVESKYYVPGSKVETVDYVVGSIQDLLDVKLIGRALDVAQGAVTVDPRSTKARLAWADMLLMAKYNQRAFEEYQNVLKLDPGNEDANAGIAKVREQGDEDQPELFN